MSTYIIDIHGDGARYSDCVLRQDFYSWLIENEISANDIKWDFDEIIKKWSKKKTNIHSVSDELSNNEFNGPGLSEHTTIEVVDEETDRVVFTSKLDKNSLKKFRIKTSISDYKSSSNLIGTKYIVETGSQGDVYLRYRLETESEFDPSKLVLEANEIDDDVLIINANYDDPSSDLDFEDSGYDDKGCSPEYVVVENGVNPKKLHPFKDTACSDWFHIGIKPIRDGFYEVKKCDEEVSSVLLKWMKNQFYRQDEQRTYDKNWKIKSIKIVDVKVPFEDIVFWRGLKQKT